MRRSVTTALLVVATLAVAAVPAPAAPMSAELAEMIAPGAIATPWEIVQLPDGRKLITGFSTAGDGAPKDPRVHVVATDGKTVSGVAYSGSPDVTSRKFLGLALPPDFDPNSTSKSKVYLYETYSTGGGATRRSRIVRLTWDGTAGTLTFDDFILLDGIRSDFSHDGGRLLFRATELFATTGDVHDPSTPQDLDSLNGKILRLNADGSPVAGNPFNNGDGVVENRDYIYSYGHRHPQGLAFDAGGRLWETEHGPSGEAHAPAGARNGRDELNLIEPRKNYGWPLVAGEQYCTDLDTVAPVVRSGQAPAWAMGDLEYSTVDGYLYAPALNGQHLHVFDTAGGTTVTRHAAMYPGTYGRLRTAVLLGTDLWIATHNDSPRILRLGLEPGDGAIPFTSYTPPAAPVPRDCVPDPGPAPALPTDFGTPAQAPVTTPIPPAPAALPLPLPLSAASPADPVAAVRRVLGQAQSSLRTLGLRRILRRGSLGTRIGGLPAGRVTLRLELRRAGHKALTVAVGTTGIADRSALTVRARLTPSGRAALRRATRARLVLRAVYTPRSGASVTRTAAVTATRAGIAP